MAVTFARYEGVAVSFLEHFQLMPTSFRIYYVRHTEMRVDLSEDDQNKCSHFFALSFVSSCKKDMCDSVYM